MLFIVDMQEHSKPLYENQLESFHLVISLHMEFAYPHL